MSVTLQPDAADAVSQPCGNGDINHLGMRPDSAR
jgi:hypothetical protein